MFNQGDWVKEKTSVGQGKVVKIVNNGGGKQLVTYRMVTGQTAKQFADFLEMSERPAEAAVEQA